MSTFLFLSVVFLFFIIERSLVSLRKETRTLFDRIYQLEKRIVSLEFEYTDLKLKDKLMRERHNRLTESHSKLGATVASLKKDFLLSGVFVKNTKES